MSTPHSRSGLFQRWRQAHAARERPGQDPADMGTVMGLEFSLDQAPAPAGPQQGTPAGGDPGGRTRRWWPQWRP